ncbi:MAG: LysR family transcriptional regulator [Verrucomicrobia bacterium]|nr:LysR family transcriptional regulator [Verrucomicrobiota bacterium]
MQCESLRVFCDLAQTGSFTKTAQINGVTQSAVSQTISALERHFNSQLMLRSKKNFRLTAEGEVVYDYSLRLLQAYDAIQSTLQELNGVISGEFRVSTVYSIGLHELPPCLKHFLQKHPNVNVHVQYRRANHVYEDVLGNAVDLGLVAYPSRDTRLETIPWRKDPLILACHPRHPLAMGKKIQLKQLTGQKFINFEEDIPTRKALDRIFKQHGVRVENIMELDNVETVKAMVENDAGVAILPERTIKQEVANRTLVGVQIQGNYQRQLGIIHKKDKVLSPALKRFVKLLKETP